MFEILFSNDTMRCIGGTQTTKIVHIMGDTAHHRIPEIDFSAYTKEELIRYGKNQLGITVTGMKSLTLDGLRNLIRVRYVEKLKRQRAYDKWPDGRVLIYRKSELPGSIRIDRIEHPESITEKSIIAVVPKEFAEIVKQSKFFYAENFSDMGSNIYYQSDGTMIIVGADA